MRLAVLDAERLAKLERRGAESAGLRRRGVSGEHSQTIHGRNSLGVSC